MITISYKPAESKLAIPTPPIPADALSFQQYQHTIAALGKHYEVTLLDARPDAPKLVEFKIVDGLRRTYHVQKLASVWQCSCKEFVHSQTDHCEHIGLLQHAARHAWNIHFRGFQKVERAILVRKNAPNYRGSGLRFKGYSGQSDGICVYTTGTKQALKTAPVIESVALPVFRERFDMDSMVLDGQLLASKPVSDGILSSPLKLYDYQEEIFASMLKAKKSVCSMVMGSGKTLTSIACFGWIRKHVKPGARALIICPKSLKIQWGKEIKRALGLDSWMVNGTKGLGGLGTCDIEIVTYQTFAKHHEKFQAQKYDLVIMDEIQFIRNDESKAWKAAKTLKSEYFFGLSGTVIENRLDDLYSIMDVIAPGSLGPKWKFNDQFQNVISVNRKVLIFSGLKNIEQLHEKIKGRVFGYDKLQLPPIAHVYKSVSMSPAQKAQHDDYYDNAQRLLAKSLSSGLSHSEKMLLQSLLLKARQACNALDLLTKQPERPSVKTQEILSDVKQLIADGHKIVLFSQWTEYLDLLHREFAKLGIGCVFFTGRETERQRAKSLDSFANNSKINVFLASDAGGVGVDGLQMSADVVIHTELPWNPARLDQRTGRVHRLGQSKPVQAFYYYASGTIEEKMLQVLQGKRDIRTLSLDVPKE
jgi:SNF2 family DNA or RNA helicase